MTATQPPGVSTRLNAHRRLLIALVVAGAAALSLPATLPPSVRLTIAWDSGVVVFLMMTWWVVQKCPQDQMQQTVLANDQGRVGILLLVLLATGASLAAIFFLVQKAEDLSVGPPLAQVALAVCTIVCSWFLTHVMFALHYAHRFYRDDPDTPESDATGGLKFPGDEAPHYWDFLYFAFVIGMTSQVSDVQVTSRPMRRLVLWQRIGKSIRPWPHGTARLAHSLVPRPRCDGAQWRLCRLASRYW